MIHFWQSKALTTNKPLREVEIKSIRVNEVVFKSILSRMVFKTCDVRLSH